MFLNCRIAQNNPVDALLNQTKEKGAFLGNLFLKDVPLLLHK